MFHLDKKYQRILIDVAIVICLILVVVLIDFFIVSLRSSKGEDRGESLSSNVGEKTGAKAEFKEDTDISAASLLDEIKPGEKIFLPILNFHHIGQAPAEVSEITASYYIQPDEFSALLQGLKAAGYQFYFTSEMIEMLRQGIRPPDKALVLTFDDGNLDFYTNAWPILKQNNLKSSVYIMTGVKGEDFMNKDQMGELVASELVELGSHTVWHPKLTQVPAEEALKEMKDSKKFLEDFLSKEVTVLCYPFGIYDQAVKDMTKEAGYLAGLTFDQDAWQNPRDLYELKRISVYPGLNVVKFLDKLKNNP